MHKQQILMIHGGTTFDDYDTYLANLKAYPLERIMDRQQGWKDYLAQVLGVNYDVIYPSMPRNWSVKYHEWALWMEKFFPLLRDDIILIGHSLGGTFLLKYLSENTFPVTIKALILVAPAYEDTPEESLGDFRFTLDATCVRKQCKQIILYHARDDTVVPYADTCKIADALPEAEVHLMDRGGHFLDADFPELVTTIRSLASS